MQYKLIANSSCILQTSDTGVESTIPNDSGNKDWAAYQRWLEADPGNIPEPADEI